MYSFSLNRRHPLFASFGQFGVKDIKWPSLQTDESILSFVIFGLGPMCTLGIKTGLCWIFFVFFTRMGYR